MASSPDVTHRQLDFYAVLDVDPSATADELRTAFRRAVLRHHPDRSGAPTRLATRRTSLLNRAWSELRDPGRRRSYDDALDRGEAATLAWPVASGEVPPAPGQRTRRPRRGRPAAEPSPWHQPAWRSVEGFRVPAAVARAEPDVQRRWIVEHYIEGQDWRDHRERYWLRFAARQYRERGRLEEWVGAVERLVEIDPSFDTLARSGLREAYEATDGHLAGATFLAEVGERWLAGSSARGWVEREQRTLLADFRERHVRRGPPATRAANADLLFDYLAGMDLEPAHADLRAAYLAHRRAGNADRAATLLERLLALPIGDGDGWYGRVQLLTDAGELERASTLLAEVARGEHPDALDPGRVRGEPSVRLARARARLERARAKRERSAARARAKRERSATRARAKRSPVVASA
jgi:tetratricopeptide (TPR) repeat protein